MKKKTGIITAAIVLGTMFGTAAPAFADSLTTANSTSSTTTTSATPSTTTTTTNTASVPGVSDNTANTTNTADTNTTGTNSVATNDTNTSTTNSTDTANSTTTNTSDTSNTTANTAANTTTGTTTGTTDPTSITASSYLYFVTQVTQAINVALASNDLQKAELLAKYGQIQVADANALSQSGLKDAANQVLTQAASDQALAAVVDTTASQSGQASPTAVNTTKEAITANVMALTNALQHVGNAKAQAALEKNIAKAFGRMQKHIKKEENHQLPVTTASTSNNTTQTTAVQTSGTQSTSSVSQDPSSNEQNDQTEQNQSTNTSVTSYTSVNSHQEHGDGGDGYGKSEGHGGGHHGNH